SFFFLGVFISVLGPALPALSRAVGQSEGHLGLSITSRGLGYLAGSAASSVPPAKVGLSCANRATMLSLAVLGLGVFSAAIAATRSFAHLVMWTTLQGACGGAVDTLGNCLITVVWGDAVAPWMQALHFLFSLGALVSPAVLGA
ncbi:unnamed protein product, partial [Phaeothamnion confervicola]